MVRSLCIPEQQGSSQCWTGCSLAGMQRTHGMQIQCMRMEEGLKAEDYIAYGKGHQFTDIVSPVGEDQIQVINLFTDEVQMTNKKSFQ